MDMTSRLFFAAKLYARRPAILWIGGGVTYALLAAKITAAACKIEALGIARQQLVAINVKDAHHHGIVILALMRLGIASISLETGQDSFLESGAVQILISDKVRPPGKYLTAVVDESWFIPVTNVVPKSTGFMSGDDICRVALTSGTTGRAIAIPATVNEASYWHGDMPSFGDDGLYHSMMGYTAMACVRLMMQTLRNGGGFCLAGTAQETYDTIMLCGVNHVLCSTAQLRALTSCAQQAGAPLRSLSSLLVTGSFISSSLIAAAQRFVANNILVAYGATQSSLVAIAPAALLDGRPGAAGFVIPAAEVEALDDAGNILPPGQNGELRIRTRVSEDKLKVASFQAAEMGFHDGWFYPGDIGTVETDGMLMIAGRKSELINVGGIKIAPEIADEILTGLAGVQDAAAFGVKNEAGEEQLWAAVVTLAPPDIPALVAACREKLGAAAPSVILRAAAIPRNAAGKIMRQQLQREVMELSGRLQAE